MATLKGAGAGTASGVPIFRKDRISLVGDCVGDNSAYASLVSWFSGSHDQVDVVSGLEVFGDVASDADGSCVGVDVPTGEDVLVGLVEASLEACGSEAWEEGVGIVAFRDVDECVPELKGVVDAGETDSEMSNRTSALHTRRRNDNLAVLANAVDKVRANVNADPGVLYRIPCPFGACSASVASCHSVEWCGSQILEFGFVVGRLGGAMVPMSLVILGGVGTWLHTPPPRHGPWQGLGLFVSVWWNRSSGHM